MDAAGEYLLYDEFTIGDYMEIPLQAQVECTDGIFGLSAYVLINPVIDKVTHLVVREDTTNIEYIVPVDIMDETIADTIRLHCSKAELKKMPPFIKTTFIEEKVIDSKYNYPGGLYGGQAYFYLPYVTSEETVQVRVEHQQIPGGELAIQRGTRVEATDGYIGKVDEFVVNPKNGDITHLVMREGHLWGQKDVIIPLSELGTTLNDTVFLKLDKHQIESLPTFPLQRRWS
jgi:sporulation protein YlmC with PRC-barrel domain